MSAKMDAMERLAVDLVAVGVPLPMAEYRFCDRRWRFDYAWPDKMVAVEIDGGTWAGGRHTSGTGYQGDCEKLNRAAIMGWKVLRFTPTMLREGGCADVIKEALRDDH